MTKFKTINLFKRYNNCTFLIVIIQLLRDKTSVKLAIPYQHRLALRFA